MAVLAEEHGGVGDAHPQKTHLTSTLLVFHSLLDPHHLGINTSQPYQPT